MHKNKNILTDILKYKIINDNNIYWKLLIDRFINIIYLISNLNSSVIDVEITQFS